MKEWAGKKGKARRVALLCALPMLLCGPAHALAERAVLLPHSGDPQLVALREAAYQAVKAALVEQGIEVSAYTPKDRAAAGDARGCKQIGCAPALLAALPAEVAVAVAVWYGKDKPQVNVTLVDAAGNRFPDVSPVDEEGADSASRAALVGARALQLLGPGPWVEIQGTPEGANVVIDGQAVGTLPYRAAMSSGDHRLEIRAHGFAAQEYAVQLPLDPTATTRIALALAPATNSNAKAAPSKEPPAEAAMHVSTAPEAATDPSLIDREPPLDEASPFNYVIGGVLAAGGIALATIDPVRASARDGECANPDCTRVYTFGSESLLKVIAGGVLLSAGVVMMLWRPIRVEADVTDDSAALRVRGTF
jgi:PEGA domain